MPAKSASAKPPPIKHVFVINLENKNYDETFGPDSPAPYLSQDLVAKGELLTQYFAIGHVSLDNYIAEISGQGPSKQTQLDCFTHTDFVSTGTGDLGQALGDGCVYPKSVKTIADQVAAKKLTWKGYMEDMVVAVPAPGDRREGPVRRGRRVEPVEHVRDPTQPVRVLPLDRRLADLRDRTWCRSPRSRPISRR